MLFRSISQNTAGVRGVSEAGDAFGSSVEVLDGGLDETPSLIIAAPNESIGSITSSGAFHILPTEIVDGTIIVSAGEDTIFHLGQVPFAASSHKGALMGTAIASIEGVIHVGVPGYTINLNSAAGAIFLVTD